MSDSPVEFEVRPLGDQEYLVTIRSGTQTTESRFMVTPDVLDALGTDGATDGASDGAAEERIVRETALFLLDHQPLIDLPPMVDLADVAAAYDGYLDALRRRLTR